MKVKLTGLIRSRHYLTPTVVPTSSRAPCLHRPDALSTVVSSRLPGGRRDGTRVTGRAPGVRDRSTRTFRASQGSILVSGTDSRRVDLRPLGSRRRCGGGLGVRAETKTVSVFTRRLGLSLRLRPRTIRVPEHKPKHDEIKYSVFLKVVKVELRSPPAPYDE